MSDANDRFQKALRRKYESKNVEFKEGFRKSTTEWCEIVKDIVAMSNTGGGVILFGLNNNGTPSGEDTSAVAQLDPATITDKVYRYTRHQYSDFQILDDVKEGQAIVGLVLGGSPIPLVFEEPGTYPIEKGGKKGHQAAAFSKGTVYFRHGAKSEPGTTEDLRGALDRRLKFIREEWLSGVKKVVSAPSGSQVSVLPREVVHSANPEAIPIRLTDDPKAPGYQVIGIDASYPYRQKEVIEELNRRRSGLGANAFDILCARRVYATEDDPRYCHKGRFTSPQYSEAFLDWLGERLDADADFFDKCRAEFRRSK